MQAKTKPKLESTGVQDSLEVPPVMGGSFKATVKRLLRGYPVQCSLWPNREDRLGRGWLMTQLLYGRRRI